MSFDQFLKIIRVKKNAALWYSFLVEFFAKYGFQTNEQKAQFLAQTLHESNDYTHLSENLNYTTASRVQEVFRRRLHLHNRQPEEFVLNPKALANLVYGGRDDLGNGPFETNDGWTFRGRGVLQITGRANYQGFADSIGMNIMDAVEYAETPRGAIESAFWWWRKNSMLLLGGNVDAASRRVNGGTHGLDDRRARYNRAITVLSADIPRSPKYQAILRTLRYGSSGQDVLLAQQKLGMVNADGKFGNETLKAVKNFQARKGLTNDGIIGPKTAEVLLYG